MDETCHYHDNQPALAHCTQCEEPICHICHGSDLRGFAVCKNCQREVQKPALAWEDPQHEAWSEALLNAIWGPLRAPNQFWNALRPHTNWLPALVFGIVCIIWGNALYTVWEFLLNPELEGSLRENLPASSADLPSPVLRAMSVARVFFLAPFIYAVRVFLLRATLKLFGEDPSWTTPMRIFGYACAGYMWLMIPPIMGVPIGHVLMIVWVFNIEVGGVRHFYPDLGPIKSMFAVLIPMLIAILIQCM